MARYKLAILGAGDMPIAISLSCFTIRSPKRIRLLYITSSIASRSAFGENPYLVATSVFDRYSDNQAKQSAVLILGYIAMSLYVKRLALGGSVNTSRSVFISAEFLKYRAWSCTIGWSVASTQQPSACGRLPQLEQTGCPEIGSLWSLISR